VFDKERLDEDDKPEFLTAPATLPRGLLAKKLQKSLRCAELPFCNLDVDR